MPPIITVDVMVWFTHNGEERFLTEVKKMFSTDAEWVARQYAEVNDGHCKIFHGTTKIADYKVN